MWKIKLLKTRLWKIRDGVDLNVLKFFGYEVFKFDYDANKPLDPPVCRKLIKRTKRYEGLAIFIENRILQLREFDIEGFTSTQKVKRKYIKDLIKEGLVEKVVKQ